MSGNVHGYRLRRYRWHLSVNRVPGEHLLSRWTLVAIAGAWNGTVRAAGWLWRDGGLATFGGYWLAGWAYAARRFWRALGPAEVA